MVNHRRRQSINQPPDPSAGLTWSVENLTFVRLLQLCEIFLTTRVACSRDYMVMECSAEGNLPSTQTYNWQYFHCHFHHNWPDKRHLQQYILHPLGFQHHWKVYHSTFTFSMLCKKYNIPLSLLLSLFFFWNMSQTQDGAGSKRKLSNENKSGIKNSIWAQQWDLFPLQTPFHNIISFVSPPKEGGLTHFPIISQR